MSSSRPLSTCPARPVTALGAAGCPLPVVTVFAIWNHGSTSETDYDGRFMLGHDLRALANAPSENLVMVKANYWFGI